MLKALKKMIFDNKYEELNPIFKSARYF